MNYKKGIHVIKMPNLNFRVGDTAILERYVRKEDIKKMVEISEDWNPLHTDAEYTRETRFKRIIAPGLFCTSMISAILGTKLPGYGTVILSETMHFLNPVFVNDSILAQVKIEEIESDRNRIRLSFFCKNQEGLIVMTGEAKVLMEM